MYCLVSDGGGEYGGRNARRANRGGFFLDDGERRRGTHAALNGEAQFHLKIGQRACPATGAAAHFGLGDGIANADVHSGYSAVMRIIINQDDD